MKNKTFYNKYKNNIYKDMEHNNSLSNKGRFLIAIGLITSFLLLSFVSAATDTVTVDDNFKINQKVDYKKPCFNNGTYCSNAAVCNFTVYNPDNTVLLNNTRGTYGGAYYNVSFTPLVIGVYKVDMVCADGALKGAETLYFEVTGGGYNNSTSFYVIILLISAALIATGFLMKDAPITILGTFGLYFIGIYILFNGIVGVKDLITTWALGIILLGVAGYISIRSAYELIVDTE